MSNAKVQDSSRKLSAHLITLLQSRGPCTVALFYPIQKEPDLMHLPHSPLLEGWRWCLPVCQGEGENSFLRFSQLESPQKLREGRFGIPVPEIDNWVEPQFILVPCLGFNLEGFRLGYGQGWYDRTLSKYPTPLSTAGVAWDASAVSEPFQDSWDIPMGWVVTESGVVFCKS